MSTDPMQKVRSDAYKTSFDYTVLIFAHLLLLPLWALLWTVIPLLIWLGDRGPVFYKQERFGRGGRIFTVLKFRTMILGAEDMGPAWTVEGDPRVTTVGKILRRTALDELPELLSIWKRDMSFVGPRALDVQEQRELEQLIPGFAKRLEVLPGLTGLAQVYNTNDDAASKFKYDLEYLERRGPWLDARLIFLSVLNTVAAKWDRRSGKDSMEASISASKNGHLGGHDTGLTPPAAPSNGQTPQEPDQTPTEEPATSRRRH
jgi:lipopolysaccharide/colanic/teichoic acid biosynthesis glycosyltransferase